MSPRYSEVPDHWWEDIAAIVGVYMMLLLAGAAIGVILGRFVA